MATKNTVKLGFFKGPQFQIHSNARAAQYGSDKYPFQFGMEKAQQILDCIEELKSFVASGGKSIAVSGAKPVQTVTATQAPGPDRFDMQVEDNMRDACGC